MSISFSHPIPMFDSRWLTNIVRKVTGCIDGNLSAIKWIRPSMLIRLAKVTEVIKDALEIEWPKRTRNEERSTIELLEINARPFEQCH